LQLELVALVEQPLQRPMQQMDQTQLALVLQPQLVVALEEQTQRVLVAVQVAAQHITSAAVLEHQVKEVLAVLEVVVLTALVAVEGQRLVIMLAETAETAELELILIQQFHL
jgi:hypothetical protein